MKLEDCAGALLLIVLSLVMGSLWACHVMAPLLTRELRPILQSIERNTDLHDLRNDTRAILSHLETEAGASYWLSTEERIYLLSMVTVVAIMGSLLYAFYVKSELVELHKGIATLGTNFRYLADARATTDAKAPGQVKEPGKCEQL